MPETESPPGHTAPTANGRLKVVLRRTALELRPLVSAGASEEERVPEVKEAALADVAHPRHPFGRAPVSSSSGVAR